MQFKLVAFRGKWCAAWTDGTGTRRSSLRLDATPENRPEAERRLADQVRKPAGKTVGEIVGSYIADLKARRKPSAERAAYAWLRLGPTFGHLRPDHLTRELSREYRAARAGDGVSRGTIHTELGMMKSALRWANKDTPAVIELPGAARARERYLTREEYIRLRDGAGAPHVRLFIILALTTAGRASAILGLTWERVDFDRGLIRLDDGGEHRKGRAIVPMTKSAREALLEAKKAALTEHVIEWAGKPVAEIKKGVSRAAQRAHLADVSPHVLRHTAAVWMAEAGRPMSEIARYLGHNDSRITEKVYAKFSPDFLRGAAAALEV